VKHPARLKALAVQLRQQGRSVPAIADELGIARSTAWQWLKAHPLDASAQDRELRRRLHSRRMTDARWAAHRLERDRRRATIMEAAAAEVGDLSGRDLLLIGAVAYWCEGKKAKPWRTEYRLTFTNSDARLVGVFVRLMLSMGVGWEALRFRLSIHDTADVQAATRWWADRLRLPEDRFDPPTLKRHTPKTNRRNVAADYHGCLVVSVSRNREVYWRLEGVMNGIAELCTV
jgi:hypothetical protein